MASGSRTLGYSPQLNGLRALAIAMVVAAHGWGKGQGGWLGVEVFFVLSGFLITCLLTGEHDRTGSVGLGRFYMRRIFRLSPALLVFLAVAFAWALHTHQANSTYKSYMLYAVSFRANLFPVVQPTGVGHVWSLAVEDQFYFVWPILLFAALYVGNRKAAAAVGVMGIISSEALTLWMVRTNADIYWIYHGPASQAPVILLGCLLGLAYTSGALDRFASSRLLRVATVAGVAVIAISTVAVPDWKTTSWFFAGPLLLFGVLTAVVITGFMLQESPTRRLFSWRPVVWIGLLSYSIYLWHAWVLAVFPHWGTAKKVVLFMVLAIASYYLVERPGLAIKKRFEGPREKPANADDGLRKRPVPTKGMSSGAERAEGRTLGYQPQLDGLRAAAIALVIIIHAVGVGGKGRGGWIGVEIFFVLSGFLITSLVLAETRANRAGIFSVGRFYARRIFRLWPAYFVFISTVLVYAAIAQRDEFREWATQVFLGVCFVYNIYTQNHKALFGVGAIWSLDVEEQFYLFWALALLAWSIWGRRNVKILFGIAVGGAVASTAINIAIAANGGTWQRLYHGLDTNAVSLLIGASLGIAYTSGWLDSVARSRSLRIVPYVFAAVTLFWLLYITNQWTWIYLGPVELYYVLTAVTIAVLVLQPQVLGAKILAWAPIVVIGQLSYSLYLWNDFAVGVLPRGHGMRQQLVHGVLGLVLTAVFALVSYFGVEKWGLRAKKRYEVRRGSAESGLAEPAVTSSRTQPAAPMLTP